MGKRQKWYILIPLRFSRIPGKNHAYPNYITPLICLLGVNSKDAN